MNQSNLTLSAVSMLVEFNASVWTARKLDRKASDEVIQSNNAGSDGAALRQGMPSVE